MDGRYSIALVASEMLQAKSHCRRGSRPVRILLGQSGAATHSPLPGAQSQTNWKRYLKKALRTPRRPLPQCGRVSRRQSCGGGQGTPIAFNPAITSRPQSAPSPSAQLAPTVLVPSETQTVSASATKPEPRPPKQSMLGMALLVLIVLAGGTVVFSATELRVREKPVRSFLQWLML